MNTNTLTQAVELVGANTEIASTTNISTDGIQTQPDEIVSGTSTSVSGSATILSPFHSPSHFTSHRPTQLITEGVEYIGEQGMLPTVQSRRGSHGDGRGHQIRVCMFTMPMTCVLPIEQRPFAHLYATVAGYPYYDPRQLQGGGVTTNLRTKPNPLLQYHSQANVNQIMQQHRRLPHQVIQPQMGGPIFPLKQQEFGNYFPSPSSIHQSTGPPPSWSYQDLSHLRYDSSRRGSLASYQYHQRRHRRSYESGSQSLPGTSMNMPTQTQAGLTGFGSLQMAPMT